MKANTEDIAPTIDGLIKDYYITGTSPTPVVVPVSSCSGGECSYNLDMLDNDTTVYTVSVAARNAVGLGEMRSTREHSKLNFVLELTTCA